MADRGAAKPFCIRDRLLAAALAVPALLAGAAPSAHAASARDAASCASDGGVVHGIGGKALDGVTFELAGGGVVRLAGVIAPESGSGAQAAREALDRLVAGSKLKLMTLGNDSDRYGRIVAQIFAENGPGGIAGDGPAWVQGEMVARGLLLALARGGSRGCAAALVKLEAAARASWRGIWRESGHGVKRAGDVEQLNRLADTFQIVEGRVLSVGRAGTRVYLNFGSRWSRDFTLVAASARLARFRAAGVDLETLAGRRVRVRGWLERRGGPMIEIEDPEQIELAEEAGRLE